MDREAPGGAEAADPRCERAGLLLSLLLDRAATPDQEREAAEHVGSCAACGVSPRIDAAVRERLRARARDDVPEGFVARVVAALRAERAAAAARHRVLRLGAAAAIVVAAATGTLAAVRNRAQGPPHRDVAVGDASAPDARNLTPRTLTRWALARPAIDEGR